MASCRMLSLSAASTLSSRFERPLTISDLSLLSLPSHAAKPDSISLAVKDIAASQRFYQKLGFTVFAGDAAQNWLILKNGPHAIGLYQGMFERNTLTFNPGWDSDAQPLETFTDIRQLQRQLLEQGVELQQQADENSSGPASFVPRLRQRP